MSSFQIQAPSVVTESKMSPVNINTRNLSTSFAGSVDLGSPGSPWLPPAQAPEDETVVTNQDSSCQIQEPKIIDILVNDQKIKKKKGQRGNNSMGNGKRSQKSDTFNQTFDSRGLDGHQRVPSLAIQLNNIKRSVQGHQHQDMPLSATSSSNQTSGVRQAAQGQVFSHGRQKTMQAIITQNSHLSNAQPTQPQRATATIPPKSNANLQISNPQFLKTDRFLQISQKQVTVNQDAIQLRNKQKNSLNYRQKDLQSCLSDPENDAVRIKNSLKSSGNLN